MIVIYGKENCTYCLKAKYVASQNNIEYVYHDIVQQPEKKDELFSKKSDVKTVPQIWDDDFYVGGYAEFMQYIQNNNM